MLLLIKIVVTVLVILALAAVAEFASSRLAGVLAGYPIGTAIVLYFYGLEQGVDFASASATYNLVGLVQTLVFACCYLLVLRRHPAASPLLPSLAGFAGYLTAGLCLSGAALTQAGALLLVSLAILAATRFARHNGTDVPLARVPYTCLLLCGRAAMAATFVVMITSLAGVVGPRWAGLLSAFPLALYPLLLMVHLQYGSAQAVAILSQFPRGLWSVLCYSLTVAYSYPALGLVPGTLCGFAAATLGLLLINMKGVCRQLLRVAVSPRKSWP